MKTLIPLSDAQIQLVLYLIEAEQLTECNDVINEQLNDLRRTVENESGMTYKQKQYTYRLDELQE
tara:strand:+ start:3764 stop:3958 length:195 start_codon:yes stop_codon:yes gene_type:complete